MEEPDETDFQRGEVPDALAGERLDKVAAILFQDFSRAELTRWIGAGDLTLNGETVKPKTKVFGGEQLQLIAQVRDLEAWHEPQAMALDVIYEDADILVLNKPAGLVVHPGAGNRDRTLVNGLLHYRRTLAELPRAGIVHRLDKDTSGLMVVAASSAAYRYLVAAIQARQVARHYVAVCEGAMVAGQDIDTSIGRDPRARRRQAVRDDGKPAFTEVRVRDRYRVHTLIEARLGSGRTHQIRVHLQSIGHPLVGDRLYGSRGRIPKGAEASMVQLLQSFPRQALHAAHLAFEHPVSKEFMAFDQPPPEDFAHLTELLAADADLSQVVDAGS